MIWKVWYLWGVTLLIIGCDTCKPLDFPDTTEEGPGLFSGPKGKFEWHLPPPTGNIEYPK